MRTLKEFLAVVVKDWVAAMSGAVGLLITIGQLVTDISVPMYWIVAALCFVTVCFRAWLMEHRNRLAMPAPAVLIQGTDGQRNALFLENVGPVTAYSVQICNLETDEYAVDFETVNLGPGRSIGIRATVRRKSGNVVLPATTLIDALASRRNDSDVQIEDLFSMVPLARPVLVHYRDASGKSYATEWEVRANFNGDVKFNFRRVISHQILQKYPLPIRRPRCDSQRGPKASRAWASTTRRATFPTARPPTARPARR